MERTTLHHTFVVRAKFELSVTTADFGRVVHGALPQSEGNVSHCLGELTRSSA